MKNPTTRCSDFFMANEQDRFPLLPAITGLFVTVLVLIPSTASKFIAIGPFNVVGGTLFFPISYLFNDILTEVYGYEKSRRIIWIGFAMQLFAAAMYALIQWWPAPAFWHNQAAYDVILGQAPRVVVASLSAYFCGEFVNSYIISRLKYAQKGKTGSRLALRFVASTFFGEFVDSVIFITLAFYGTIETAELIRIILTIWIFKSLYEVVTLPISMPLVAWIKKYEGVDKIDRPETTDYTPFKI
jgi:uncharacterized integral membrane protein (TIGR00697 family)